MELNLIYGHDAQDAENKLRSNSRHGDERVKPDRAVGGATFNGMEMQSVSVHKAFHDACSAGNRWQMSPV
jgi:hypothetical protein